MQFEVISNQSPYKRPEFMWVGKSFWEAFRDEVEPWRRELKRAREQLAKLRKTFK